MKRTYFDKYALAIAEQFHLSLDQMFSEDRYREVVDARQMLYFLCTERPIQVASIQRFMTDVGCPVTHSTIIHGYKRAKKLIDSDPDYEKMIEKIRNV